MPIFNELSLCLRPIHWCWTRAIRWAWRYCLEPSPICHRQTQPGWLLWFPACSDRAWDSASPRFGLVLFAAGFNFYFEWFWLLNVWKRLFICFSFFFFLFSIEIGRVVSQFIYQAWFHNLWQSRSGTARDRQDLGMETWRLIRAFEKHGRKKFMLEVVCPLWLERENCINSCFSFCLGSQETQR